MASAAGGHHIFGSDRPLLYDVYPWNELGFAVANFGDNLGTLSAPIHGLADEVGKAQLFIMTHIDAQRTQPPSPNTVMRLGKVINRVQAVLTARAKDYNELRIEEGHASADLIPWTMHPAPFFGSSIVRNRWLKEYNRLVMIALTNIYQHSDNNLALTVTRKFAADIWQYFNEIKLLVGMELLMIPEATVRTDAFLFTDAHYQLYAPEAVTLNFEALDTPGPIQARRTEDDIRPLFEGIPANMIVPLLKQYPASDADQSYSGATLPVAAAAPGVVGGEAVMAAGGHIGKPMI